MSRISTRAAELSERLAQSAQAVCRHYLPAGRREGRYWMIGDVAGTPGRSLYVRLFETERGAIGNWVDAATGEHGDLVDLIRLNQRHGRLADTIDEAERFLSLPLSGSDDTNTGAAFAKPTRAGSPTAARRLFAASKPLTGSLAATYLRSRSITRVSDLPALRFHPRCYYRPNEDDTPGTAGAFPALIAAVTDSDGVQTGTHRTWLDPSSGMKAKVASPRRAMGNILGNAVRFGLADDVLIAGEGIETMLSLREVLPTMPMAAATSSAHLAAILFPPTLRRLYVARDRDAAGDAAFGILTDRAQVSGIELLSLMPDLADFNDDLRHHGACALGGRVRLQLHEQDRTRFTVNCG
ncbi:toprim domain-containing protein [Sphingobium sp. HBC34]|uniref:Toprim domain-containing protein n=1 Tax=Sphingobium cyanobacteriorum TaxID=3063954 RepID=A0ABT8ZUG7_9SPHN|nr:toprim domain-containing protein [Sphingobium sp. HBC34]MDO7837594.1 toprim domain-containing protein [Sphingobium sp. HBC34]